MERFIHCPHVVKSPPLSLEGVCSESGLLDQRTLPQVRWRHIFGKTNPADCATRGLSASQLSIHQLWWSRPLWLADDSTQWPNCSPSPIPDQSPAMEERKSSIVQSLQIIASNNKCKLQIITPCGILFIGFRPLNGYSASLRSVNEFCCEPDGFPTRR